MGRPERNPVFPGGQGSKAMADLEEEGAAPTAAEDNQEDNQEEEEEEVYVPVLEQNLRLR